MNVIGDFVYQRTRSINFRVTKNITRSFALNSLPIQNKDSKLRLRSFIRRADRIRTRVKSSFKRTPVIRCKPTMTARAWSAPLSWRVELAEKPLPAGSMSVRFWFGPETIGTIAYLAHNKSLIPNLRGGIFLEMTGNQNKIAWHHTRQHNHLLDRITNYVLRDVDHDERDFAAAPANDERVINGPGVNVPCISLNRWPYDEYHTTDDNLDIMHEDMLVGAADVAEKIVRIYASNYIPKRTFRGPVFLSGNGLWVDWRDNWELNRAIEKIMMRFEGRAFGL